MAEERLTIVKTGFRENPEGMIDATHVRLGNTRKFIPGFIERELTIQTTGNVKPPDAIVFDGKRFIPEPGKGSVSV